MSKLLFNRSEKFIKDKIKQVDLICIDLDECLFPFFTQTFIGAGMLVESFINPYQWKCLPNLLKGVLFIFPAMGKKFNNKKIENEKFMDKYEELMHGIPISLILRHARYTHRFLSPNSLKFLKYFSNKEIVIIILSLTIQPILNVLEKKVKLIHKCIGNEIEIDKNSAFFRYKLNRMDSGEDKLNRFKELLKIYKSKTPLVIGHSEDELDMVEYVKKLGGFSIGINPKYKFLRKFDLVLTSLNWKPLLTLFKN